MDFSVLGIAASGLRAQQTRVDAVGHNLANLQTTGFRAMRPELVDGAPQTGVEVRGVTQPDVSGPIVTTDSPMDVALPQGVYLAVQLPNGQIGYTQNGHITQASDGRLQAGEYPLWGSIRLGPTDTSPGLDAAGQISVPSAAGGSRVIGQLPLVTVARPEEMIAQGNGVWTATPASGTGVPFTPTANNSVMTGALDASNVQVDQEMTNLVRAQRAYQVNAQMVHVWDELASQTVQDLGRG